MTPYFKFVLVAAASLIATAVLVGICAAPRHAHAAEREYVVKLSPEEAALCEREGGCRFVSAAMFARAVDYQVNQTFKQALPLPCGTVASLKDYQ